MEQCLYRHVQKIVDGAVASLKSYSSYVMGKQRYELANDCYSAFVFVVFLVAFVDVKW
jgi:hypothetical protein